MLIGGLRKLSLIDYPGKLSAVIFTRGCNFRCPYCHNPGLVLPECYSATISPKYVYNFLRNRQYILDCVVISGGEPTIHRNLPDFLEHIRSMPYLIKLDTNGSNPEMLGDIIGRGLIDYVAMDVKAGLQRYEELTRTRFPSRKIADSIAVIKNSGIAHEFRTTVVKSLYADSDLSAIRKLVEGCRRYRLQFARTGGTILDPQLAAGSAYSMQEMFELRDRWEINTANP